MTDYKHSLNLPYTNFSMKANLSMQEPKRLEQWQSNNWYETVRLARKGQPLFILHDGPPYANGHLHCGHALNKILKDIIIKSKILSNFDAPFIPGWDCHGLPIELNVEKKIGKAGVKVEPAEFRQHCRQYAASQMAIQAEEFKRLGILGDWQHPYATMNYQYEADTVRALAKIIDKGYLKPGFKPVHWCISCGSALAEAEVEYENKQSIAIDAAFYLEDIKSVEKKLGMALDKPVLIPIWTTTPWTLPANEAVCLHPKLNYTVIESSETCFIIAEDLVDATMKRYQIEDFKSIKTVKGNQLENLLVKHPFESRTVPVIVGTHVTTDTGTGAVHTAPCHGLEDFQVGISYQLPLRNLVKNNGCYADSVDHLANLSVLKADVPVVDLLKQHHTLLHQAPLSHSYPHCWRHKSPIIFLATPQWFIKVDEALRNQLKQTIDDISWYPNWGRERMKSMVDSRPDWCISRQRAWGTPIPIFIHKKTHLPHPKTQQWLEEIALLIEQQGIEAWFALDSAEWLKEEAKDYQKVIDTLDVWFDSGVSHFAVIEKNNGLNFPADIYFEGSDQYRGWFNSSLTTSLVINQQAPFKKVLAHGYTVDAEGKKLSKSQGNYLALDKLTQQYGADVLRLWAASMDYRYEVSISEEILKRTTDTYRRIRNTARFLLANLFDFSPENKVSVERLTDLDAWIIKRTQALQEEIIAAYEQYQFHTIYQKIHNFCTIDLGSFYLDIIKDRQYTLVAKSVSRRSCQTAMFYILQALTRWLAPILSFTAEEIWQAMPGYKDDLIFIQTWYQDWPKITSINMDNWEELIFIREEVNKALESARQEGLIGSSLEAEVTLKVNHRYFERLNYLGKELRFFLITSKATLVLQQSSNLPLEILIKCTNDKAQKCARCWHRLEEVGQMPEYRDLCKRCANAMNDIAETRKYV